MQSNSAMKYSSKLLILLMLVSQMSFGESLGYGPFSDIDLSALKSNEKSIILEASADFQAVLEGKQPLHAKFDEDSPLPADGGTSFYVGSGYSLTISKSLSHFGSLSGYVYGPIIKFNREFAPGNLSTVSNLRFYLPADLEGMLNRQDRE
jgi:hypothetical protein